MKMLILFIVLILSIIVLPAQAEKGIVLNASGYVQYKYDTETRPTLQPGEYIIPYQDIDSVQKNASYKGGIFINPLTAIEYEEIELQAEQSKIDPTQTIISGLAGAGTAYLVARRKKE